MQKNPFKMKHAITLLLLLVHVVAFAQNEENNSKWSYGIEYSRDNIKIPGREFTRQIECEVSPPGCIHYNLDTRNYTLGLQFAYSIHKKFNLETALLYSNKDRTPITLVKHRYLTIPISINFAVLSIGKFKTIARGGTKFNFKVQDEDSSSRNDDFFSEVFFGASLSYQILKNLNVEAGYNYHALSINLLSPSDNNYLNRKTHGYFIRLNKKFKRKPKPEADVL